MNVFEVVATSSTRTPSTASPTITPACAIRWSAYVPKTPPCSGAGRIASPSSVSVTSPPSPVNSRASALSRSVSWPRMCAMPRRCEGDPASAHSAATAG